MAERDAAQETSGRSVALAPHFEDLEQQHDAARLGMWAFLASEVMFFGGALAAFAAYRTMHAEGFAEGSRRLDMTIGTANTAILLASSFTMALAVRSGRTGSRRGQIAGLVVTALFGIAFLTLKGAEYAHKFEDRLVPGASFEFPGLHAGAAEIFFSYYFVLTGLHALHMVIGLGLVAVVVRRAARGDFTPDHHALLETSGLYWHFVDVVWIFLFPLLYLIGRHR